MDSSGILSGIVILSLTVLFLILILRKVKQPYFIAYILSGVVLGPSVLGVVEERALIDQLGELGVILLMFFIGAEINLPDLSKHFKKPFLAAVIQVVLSFACMYWVGSFLDWHWNIIILISFVISLSSSAIIFQYLTRTGQIHSPLGMLTTGVLLVQDIMIVPMMLTLNFMAQGHVPLPMLMKVMAGGVLVILFLRAAMRHKLLKIPFYKDIEADHDLQVFLGFVLCFGMAWVTNWFGLSGALGAFVAGIYIGQDKATRWFDHAMRPFRVFLLAFFFLSIGLQIDLAFLTENSLTILFITISILLINSLINAVVFKLMGSRWRDSLYAGALLSQIGEFSFVLVSLALSLGVIGQYSYQITLSVIALTMVLTSVWIGIMQRFMGRTLMPTR